MNTFTVFCHHVLKNIMNNLSLLIFTTLVFTSLQILFFFSPLISFLNQVFYLISFCDHPGALLDSFPSVTASRVNQDPELHAPLKV